jgi:hypothetical protein
MTTRAIKKLTKKDDLISQAELNKNNTNELNEDSNESTDNENDQFFVQPKNKFDLVSKIF